MVGCFDDLEDKLFMLKMSLVFGEIINLIYCSSAPVGEDEDVMHSGHFSTVAPLTISDTRIITTDGWINYSAQQCTSSRAIIKMNRGFVTSTPRQSSNIYQLATACMELVPSGSQRVLVGRIFWYRPLLDAPLLYVGWKSNSVTLEMCLRAEREVLICRIGTYQL